MSPVRRKKPAATPRTRKRREPRPDPAAQVPEVPIGDPASAGPPEPAPPGPRELGVLPVRQTVLFPYAILPLNIGRERSVGLLNDVMTGDRTYSAFTYNVERKVPWRTLTGRQQFYLDHPVYLAYGEHLPTYKPSPLPMFHASRLAMPLRFSVALGTHQWPLSCSPPQTVYGSFMSTPIS